MSDSSSNNSDNNANSNSETNNSPASSSSTGGASGRVGKHEYYLFQSVEEIDGASLESFSCSIIFDRLVRCFNPIHQFRYAVNTGSSEGCVSLYQDWKTCTTSFKASDPEQKRVSIDGCNVCMLCGIVCAWLCVWVCVVGGCVCLC
jgi:hypothetical protein